MERKDAAPAHMYANETSQFRDIGSNIVPKTRYRSHKTPRVQNRIASLLSPQAPQSVSDCASIVVDASSMRTLNGRGRRMVFEWAVDVVVLTRITRDVNDGSMGPPRADERMHNSKRAQSKNITHADASVGAVIPTGRLVISGNGARLLLLPLTLQTAFASLEREVTATMGSNSNGTTVKVMSAYVRARLTCTNFLGFSSREQVVVQWLRAGANQRPQTTLRANLPPFVRRSQYVITTVTPAPLHPASDQCDGRARAVDSLIWSLGSKWKKNGFMSLVTSFYCPTAIITKPHVPIVVVIVCVQLNEFMTGNVFKAVIEQLEQVLLN